MTTSPAVVKIAESDADIARCFPVMKQLRQSLTRDEFASLIAAQSPEGYRIAFVEMGGDVVAVAGFRIYHMLFSGKTLYVDDLVTDEARRSQRYGETLLQWLIRLARESGCATFSLDSGVQRFRVHRFYFAQGMHINSYHFELTL
jgi:GNAT superfamily N-acetyltransferase